MTKTVDNALIVMKFGGSSLADEVKRESAVAKIRSEIEKGSRPVVVVSAMGRKKDPYATDTLLSLVAASSCSEHELDVLMSTGEAISAVVLSGLLSEKGIPAEALTGLDAGIQTDAVDGDATITLIDPRVIRSLLDEGKVPVVTGFQGVDEQGRIHTLGRGGSDTTACALGVALKADRVDIYTDVDGVYTADPRLIPEAHALKRITVDELFQMAKHGSRIVHAPAAELALSSRTKLRIRSSFSASEGTEVVSMDEYRSGTIATAVTTVPEISQLSVRLPHACDDPRAHMEAQTRAYRIIADSAISIDMFTPVQDQLVFSVASSVAERAVALLSEQGFEVSVRPLLGKVTLVGSGMHGVPGVMAQVAECLMTVGIDIVQIADSHATISLLVDENDLISAAQALHGAFGL